MSHRSRRILGMVISGFLVAASSALVAATGSNPAGASTSGSLTWGITSIDPSLDPGLVYAIDPNIITAAMCNSLLQIRTQGSTGA